MGRKRGDGAPRLSSGGAEEGKDSPSTGSGRTEVGEGDKDLCPFCGSSVAGEAGVRIVRGRGQSMQVRRTGKRHLFGKASKKLFLEWFAATGNVSFSAEKAGVARQTVSKHRLSDAEFAGEYERAIALCVPDLQARLQAWVLGRPKLDLDGDLVEADDSDFDPQLALQMLREFNRFSQAGPGQALKRGRVPRVATNAEVRAALVKGLKAFGIRVTRQEAAGDAVLRDASSTSTSRSSS
jgi:hypothetical protein